MSDEVHDDILDSKKEEEVGPLEVKITNKDKKEVSDYDDKDDEEYDSLAITEEELKEFNENK